MALPLAFSAIPLVDVDAALQRLPAEVRARVVWARKPIDACIARLRDEPLSDDLVAAATREMWGPLTAFSAAFAEIASSNHDEWRSRMADDFNVEEEQLASYVEDDDSRDTLRWVIGFLRSFMGLALSVSPDALRAATANAGVALDADPDFQHYLRGLLALMAANETRRVGGDRKRARDLLDIAFLELNQFRSALLRQGVNLTAYPDEATTERRAQLLRSANRLREVLSDDDWQTIGEARMGDLR